MLTRIGVFERFGRERNAGQACRNGVPPLNCGMTCGSLVLSLRNWSFNHV